jgi:hypothetical protein
MSWELIWKTIFIFILCAFAVMAVVTTVLGARDVKDLLRDLKEDEEQEKED